MTDLKVKSNVALAEIEERLQSLVDFEITHEDFHRGYLWWARNEQRHLIRTKEFFSTRWMRGTLPLADAYRFCDFLRMGWRPLLTVLE